MDTIFSLYDFLLSLSQKEILIFFLGFTFGIFIGSFYAIHKNSKKELITKRFECDLENDYIKAEYKGSKLIFNSCPSARHGICAKTGKKCEVVAKTPF